MGILEKNDEPRYSPIPDDRSATSSDDLIYDGLHPSRSRRERLPKVSIFTAIGAVVALVAYSTVVVTLTSMWWRDERLHGANVIDCRLAISIPVTLLLSVSNC